MMAYVRSLKLVDNILTAGAGVALWGWKAADASAGGDQPVVILHLPAVSPDPPGSFSPSKSRTEDSKLITVDQFVPAARCASCHKDMHTAWAELSTAMRRPSLFRWKEFFSFQTKWYQHVMDFLVTCLRRFKVIRPL